MEEKEGKVVKLSNKESDTAPRKLSYEELENAAHQMSEQGRKLYSENEQLRKLIEELNLQNTFKRLDYLWTVINSDTAYITEDFKVKCGEEFMKIMSPMTEINSDPEAKEEE